VGTLIALIFFNPLLHLVDIIVAGIPRENITTHIAMLHTVFNTLSTIIFLPFVKQIVILVTKLIKDPVTEQDSHYKLPVIISQSRNTVESYIMQIEREIAKMSAKTMHLLDEVYSAFEGYDAKSIDKIAQTVFDGENYIDEMNEEISAFLMECYKMRGTSQSISIKINKLLQITSGIEDLSDECASLVHSLQKYITKNGEKKTSSYEKLLPYMEQVREFFDYVSQHLSLGLTTEERKLSIEMEEKIDSTKKELKKLARHRIEDGKDVKTELHYIDIVRHVEKAGDSVFTIVNSL
jgi:phosphate:Na+ symporter